MTIKELIEYLQQEVASGTPADTELVQLQIMMIGKRIVSMGPRTMIFEIGEAPIRVMSGESISETVKAQKETNNK